MVASIKNLGLSIASKQIYENICFEIDTGEILLAEGAAGTGKSLLGITVCGLLPYVATGWKMDGDIEISGRKLIQGDYRKEIGVVLENPSSQLSGLKKTVFGELALSLECRGMPPGDIIKKVNTHATGFGITGLLEREIRTLSGGEHQRIVIACALITEPSFVFLDRPLTEIDTLSRPQLLNIIRRKILEPGGGILMTEEKWNLPDDCGIESICLNSKNEQKTAIQIPPLSNDGQGQENILEIENLSFSYDRSTPLLNSFDLNISRGEAVLVKGPNGSGKTTLARLISGLLATDSGRIILEGRDITGMKRWDIMSRVGFALQNPALSICRSTVQDELGVREGICRELDSILGLDGFLQTHPLELTQAQKKRLGIASSFTTNKRMMILDEPSQYQDEKGFAMITEAISKMTRAGLGVMVISHDPRMEAFLGNARSIRLFREGNC